MKTLTHRLASTAGCTLIFAGLAAAQFGGGPAWNVTGGETLSAPPGYARTPRFRPPTSRNEDSNSSGKSNSTMKRKAITRSPRPSNILATSATAAFARMRSSAAHRIPRSRSIATWRASEWEHKYNVATPAPTPGCPGGMTAGVSRPTPLTDNPLGTVGPAAPPPTPRAPSATRRKAQCR